ncbi:MAG TPA: outer membrane beta-barrel protein [Thermodesulfobacteriota bacterium]|nr:outer membrane beta-barrel protein [Thermodesulfobacteriota bacterium]
MRKTILTLMFLVLIIGVYPVIGNAAEVPAQPDTGSFGLGVRGGWYKIRDADEGKFYGGIQARFRVMPWLAIEGSTDYRAPSYYSGGRKITSWPFLVSALIYPIPKSFFSPYILGGGGLYYSHLENSTSYYNNAWGWHAGLGFDVPLYKRLILNVEARYTWVSFDENNFRDINGNGYTVAAGVTYYFW